MARMIEGSDLAAMDTELDCNDNSPRLTQFHQDGMAGLTGSPPCNAMCPAHGAQPSLNTSDTVSDNISDNTTRQAALVGVTYSPEDTLNNDFFFDDEFTIPFDAHLSDNMEDLNLIVMSNDETMFRKHEFRMTSSKSDSCLYNGDNELSEGELCEGNEMSQELTPSEKDLNSSGSLSDLNNGPLFSPQTSFTLGQNANESEMTSSFLNNTNKYDFDWRANKDQYMLSFDRHLLKCSSGESSLCDSTDPVEKPEPRRLTTWAIQRESSVSQGSWASNSSESHTSKKSHEVSKSHTASRPASFQKRSRSEEGRTMTSWKAIKTPSPGQSEDELGKSGEAVSAWRTHRNSYYDNHPGRDQSNMITSREMKENQMKHLHLDLSPPEASRQESVSSDYHTCSEGREAENPRRRSSPLLELYIRSKTQSDSDTSTTDRILEKLRSPEQFCNEAMVSPNLLRRLTGTWSMSTTSSRSSKRNSPVTSPRHECSKRPATLKHWSTVKNLSQEAKQTDSVLFGDLGEQHVCACDCDLSACLDCSAQIGSGVLNFACDDTPTQERSSQWPPCLNTVAIQTSLQYHKSDKLSDRYSLVDIGVQTRGRAASEPFCARSERLGNLPISKVSPVIARNRLTKHILQRKSALPDLSFLKSSLTTSSVLRATSVSNASKCTKSCQTESSTPPPVPPRVRRSVSASPTYSRESSPANYSRKSRSNSVSVCSSSSSGIDPGRSSCESQLNRLSAWSGDAQYGSSEYFMPHIKEWTKYLAVNADRICIACHARIQEVHHLQGPNKTSIEIVDSSQEKVLQTCPSLLHKMHTRPCTDEKNSDSPVSDDDPQKASIETVKLRCSKESCDSVDSGSKNESRDWITEPVKLRRPLKSCLRRRPGAKNERAMKHRSWSDPYDATILRYSQEGETRYQLITNGQGKTCWTRLIEPQTEPQQNSTPQDPNDAREADVGPEAKFTNTTVAVVPLTVITDNVRTTKPDAPRQDKETSISPDKIPMMLCACGTTHAVLHSSSDSGDGCDAAARAKKTVSFAEKVSYHSPAVSPHPSPKKTVSCGQLSGRKACPQHRRTVTKDMLLAVQNTEAEGGQTDEPKEETPPPKPPRLSQADSPPGDFIISSGSSNTTSPSTSTIIEVEQQLLVQKQELVVGVTKASELLLMYFENADSELDQETRASSRENPEIGQIVLEKLCPALVAVVTDGLRPTVRSVFGKVKNSPWRMMEDSVSQGAPARVLSNLLKDLNELDFLNTHWLKFNALIFGLLNHRALDFWLTYVCNHDTLIVNNYAATSFVSLSQTTARQLFLEMTTALQPLAKIPFRLEYNFEYKLVKSRQDEALCDLLLHKHTTSSIDGRLERILAQNQVAKRPLSVDEALDLLSNSDESMTSFSTSASIKDSVQLKIDSLKQYSAAVSDTKEKTKTLLKVTGDSIKERFKQIQKQNRAGDAGEDLKQYLPISDALLGNTRSRGRQPMRVPHLKGINDDPINDSDCCDTKKSNEKAKPSEKSNASNAQSNLIRSKLRSQSLDSIPVVKNGEVLLGESISTEKPATRTSSLTDLVSFIGKKIYDFASGSKEEKTYKEGVTNYRFETDPSVDKSSSVKAICDSAVSPGEENPEPHSEKRFTSGSELTAECNDKAEKKEESGEADPLPLPKECPDAGQAQAAEVTVRDPAVVVARRPTVTSQGADEESHSPIHKGQKPGESLSRTARMFTRRFGHSLISAFDKLLLDPKKKPVTMVAKPDGAVTSLPQSQSANERLAQNEIVGSSAVKKSSSATEFPKRYVQTLCHHIASESHQLSFDKGCILTVVKEVDKDSLLCYHEKGRGLVHRGFIKPVENKDK